MYLYLMFVLVFNNPVFQWGKITGYNNSWKTFNINVACNIFGIVATVTDGYDNEYGIFTNNYTSSSFQICCRGYGGNTAASKFAIVYILIGSI